MSEEKSSERCVLTLPMNLQLWQIHRMDTVFDECKYLYNRLIAKANNIIRNMQRTKAWKDNQAKWEAWYKDTEKFDFSAPQSQWTTEAKEAEKQRKVLSAERKSLLTKYHLSKAYFEDLAKNLRKLHADIIPAVVAQVLADRVWETCSTVIYGNGEQLRYADDTHFLSIESKTNTTAIVYKDGMVFYNKKVLADKSINKYHLELPVQMPSDEDTSSSVYERAMLRHNVCRCRIIRRPTKYGWHYMIQLILEGNPEPKVNPTTGELLYPIGAGKVGIDPGMQTMAFCGDNDLLLSELAPSVDEKTKALRRINRQMDRSRKETNPQMFDEDGEVIHKDKLSPELLNRYGKRKWKESNTYKKAKLKLRYFYSQQKIARQEQHNHLANKALAFGDTFYAEKMSYKGLAKRAKEDKVTETGKHRSKKRFGHTIVQKAPAAFIDTMRKKVTAQSGAFSEINTYTAKATQYNPIEDTCSKKSLSQRWDYVGDSKYQRDLFSAFKIQHIHDDLQTIDRDACIRDFPNFVELHEQEIIRLMNSPEHKPSSMGV